MSDTISTKCCDFYVFLDAKKIIFFPQKFKQNLPTTVSFAIFPLSSAWHKQKRFQNKIHTHH